MMLAESAKILANSFKNELGFVNRAALQVSEAAGELECIPNIGFCNYHHRKDGQTTIYEIAVAKEHQQQGWGRLLFYRVLCSAIERSHTRIVAKCPENLSSNEFYQRLGFKLVLVEPGRKRRLNRWQYNIQLPLLFYCADGGRNRYSAIASEVGWRLGLRSDQSKTPAHCQMVDNHWTGYNHQRHLAAVRHHKPLVATAKDIEHPDQLPEVLYQAKELAQYAGRVILIPKCPVPLDKRYWLGFSVPTSYAGVDPKLLQYWLEPPCGQYLGSSKAEWYGRHFTHLLGGSPNSQAHYAKHLNVISLDGNYAMKIAQYGKSAWQGVEIKTSDGCYEAFRLSLAKQKTYWHNEWSLAQEPLFQNVRV